jgi:hypothetical protein
MMSFHGSLLAQDAGGRAIPGLRLRYDIIF